jgi:hypothetical protein
MDHSSPMREPRPSLAYRVAWLFPAIGLLTFVLLLEGRQILEFLQNPLHAAAGMAAAAYFTIYAVGLARNAMKRRAL